MIGALILSLAMTMSGNSWHHGDILPWYGYGFYNNRTACGQRLTRTIVGVAHRTLPCGTRITIRWQGRTLKTRVIDRGPYGWPESVMPFDLTAGAAKALGCKCKNPYFTRHDFKWKRGW
jgi:rare lipoprotein A (peptidoglycan hydrolase)